MVLHPSLRWSPKRTLIAGLVSVPPYGTLVFEQWVAHKRRNEALRSYRQLSVRGIIINGSKLLAVQPRDSGYWYLPGGPNKAEETAQAALLRIITEHTGIKPEIGHLAYVWEHKRHHVQQLELFFVINNAQDYRHIDLSATKRGLKDLDEISFISPHQNNNLRPKFLQTTTLSKSSMTRSNAVTFI